MTSKFNIGDLVVVAYPREVSASNCDCFGCKFDRGELHGEITGMHPTGLCCVKIKDEDDCKDDVLKIHGRFLRQLTPMEELAARYESQL